jgi:hypothetical protein
MTMSATHDLPDVGAILGALLASVPAAEQPLFLAIAERMAAERYRRWADEVDDPGLRAGLIACAAREDDIADRVESVFPDPAAAQRRLREAHPDLATINRDVFAGRPLAEQFAIQAAGERLGAAAWRAFAAARPDAAGRAAFLACAPLEEASAAFLESLGDRSR